jgi:hypothetical protein
MQGDGRQHQVRRPDGDDGDEERHGGPFIRRSGAGGEDDVEHTRGLIQDEDWRPIPSHSERDTAVPAELKKKTTLTMNGEGGWRETLEFYRMAETWRRPNIMYIFFSFFLYMLAYSYSYAMIPLVPSPSCCFSLYFTLSFLFVFLWDGMWVTPTAECCVCWWS